MGRALVDIGSVGRSCSAGLTRSEQLFLARWLQLLNDETHPRWSLRPLSIGNLSQLYPASLDRQTRHQRLAIEDELSRRFATREPDVVLLTDHGTHEGDQNRAECGACRTTLVAASAAAEARLRDLVDRLISSIEDGRELDVLALTPAVAGEATAAGVPPRYMMQTCKNYVLSPRRQRTTLFKERLKEFLRHDVGREPRDRRDVSTAKCDVRRELTVKIPSASFVRGQFGSEAQGILSVERKDAQGSRRVWLGRTNIDDRLSAREGSAAELRALTPGWLALLRFCFPDLPVQAGSSLEILPSGKALACPDHRRTFSRREVKRGFRSLEFLLADENIRASLYWLSLAYEVWRESVPHAAGMIWMSIESLVGQGGPAACAEAYVDKLQSQLADDIEETLGNLAGDVDSRAKGRRGPQWVHHLPWRRSAVNDQAWLGELATSIAKLDVEPGMQFVVRDAASFASTSVRGATLSQVIIDLGLLRAVRHAVAHRGKAIAEEPLLHYLATLGCECIRALLSQRLDGTSYEGALEDRPRLQVRCDIVNGHWHAFEIPAWIDNPGQGPDGSVYYESEPVQGHTHALTLSADHFSKLAAGSHLAKRSSENAGHLHEVRLFR